MGKVIQFPAKQSVTFKCFAQQIGSGDIENAAKSLTELIGVGPDQAKKSCQHFQQQMQKDSTIILKTMQIKTAIEDGQQQQALALLQEVFAVDGPDALLALQRLSDTLKSGNA